MLYFFLLKPFKVWIFEKLPVIFGLVFPQKNNIFQRKRYKFSFSLSFSFASFVSFKALLGCLEKLEIFASDLV